MKLLAKKWCPTDKYRGVWSRFEDTAFLKSIDITLSKTFLNLTRLSLSNQANVNHIENILDSSNAELRSWGGKSPGECPLKCNILVPFFWDNYKYYKDYINSVISTSTKFVTRKSFIWSMTFEDLQNMCTFKESRVQARNHGYVAYPGLTCPSICRHKMSKLSFYRDKKRQKKYRENKFVNFYLGKDIGKIRERVEHSVKLM